MDKNSFQAGKDLWKRRIAVLCIIGMLAGLLCSRSVASIAMITFGANALWDVSPRRWLAQRWWLLGLGWIGLYALSYFWSANQDEWNAHVQVKLPFLLLPLAVAFVPPFSRRELGTITWSIAGLMCSGAAYSVSFLWRSPVNVIDGYKYAHLLPTPVYDDHIAFSTSVALSIAWIVFYLPQLPRGWQRYTAGVLALLLAAYLHLLAAKTGLIALYILIGGLIAYELRHRRGRGLLLLLVAVTALALAIAKLPTLRFRAGYSIVNLRSYMMGERNGMYSDASRVFSYRIAARCIAEHPLTGVGAGDVLDVMKEGYARWYPQVPEAQQLWPHNQWLTCAMAAGIPAALLFTLWMGAALRRLRRNRAGAFFLLVWLMLLVPLLVDPFLEVQFGVAVYLIFLLLQRKAMLDSELAPLIPGKSEIRLPKSEI